MRYFVTGATGFIGGYLVDVLLARGHEVVAVVRTPSKAQDLVAKGVEIVEGDITDKESMRSAMTGVDGVYHVAAWYKIGEDDALAHQINVDGTRNVLELMRELDIKKGVYTSTVGVFSDTKGKLATEDSYFDPNKADFLSAYEETKWKAHYEVALPMMKEGLPLVIVQPGLVYGIGDTSAFDNTLRDYLQGNLPMMPAETAFAWAHVEDVVEGHILAMEKGNVGESYIICGETKSLVDALKLAQEITGIPAPKIIAPPALLKIMSGIMSVITTIVPINGLYHPETLRGIAGVTYLADNSKAKQELGYNPRSVREGLPEILHALMDELGIQSKL